MKNNLEEKHLPSNDSKNENKANAYIINTYHSKLISYFQYLSNQTNSRYENGGVKNKISVIYLLSGIGPFILTTNIDILNLPFVDYNLNLNMLSEFLFFIINNPEINYNENNMKKINQLFLESIKPGIGDLSIIENMRGNIRWNLDTLYKLFHKSIDNLDKIQLLLSFDNPNLNINNKKIFDIFCEIMIKFHFFGEKNENIQSFFNDFLFIKWENVKNQASLIDLMITNKEISENSIFSLKNYQGKKVSKDIELKAYTSSKNHYLIDNWRNIKLVETLIIISAEFNDYTKIKTIFDWAIKNIPEILIMSLLTINIDYTKNSLMNDLILEILSSILFDKNPRIKFLNEVWQTNKDIVIYVLYKSWQNFPDLMNLSVILDLANNVLKDSLLPLVNSKYHNFSVHLGLLASKRDYLHIEKFLKKNIDKYGDEFINSLLDYLFNNVIKPCQINFTLGPNLDEVNKANILEKAQLSLESLSIILNTLNSYTNSTPNDINNKISLKTKKEISEINKIIFDIYDEIQDPQINSKEIEEEISQLLRSMFEGKISTDYIVNLLILYESSKDERKIELFSCLIHQLIVEYRYFIKYPQDKLNLLAELFGKIINNKLLKGVIETLALNYISESIKSGKEQLYNFGIIALNQIIGNISCWPKYMKKLLDMEQIKKNKELYMKILRENEKIQKRYMYEISENALKQNGKVSSPKSENKSSDIELEDNGKTNKENNLVENFDKLKYKLSGKPKSYIMNEINTININNNSINDNSAENDAHLEKVIYNIKIILDNNYQSHIFEKASEINKFLNNDETNIKIFSYILVTLKIPQSKNILYYNELFTQINNPILYKYVIKYTINYIQILLKIKSLYIEEKLFNILKNLGSWLGLITILKNKPILARDIDFRELITDSYKQDKLIITIPFVCKVFSFISKSKIFNINNPWINSILCLLKEIYFLHSLNNSIKKEIHSFFDIVKIDINSVKINIQYLNNIEKPEKENNNLDFPKWQKLHLNIDKNKLEKKVGTLNNFINNIISNLSNEKNILSNAFLLKKAEILDKKIISKIDEIIETNIDIEKKNFEDKRDMIIFLSNLLYQSILDTLPINMDVYFSKPIAASIAIVSQDFFYEFDINKYKTAVNNTIKSLLSSFSIMGFHEKLKKSFEGNIEFCIKSHNIPKEAMNYIKEIPNSEYLNIGLEEILKYITKEAQNMMNSNEEFRTQIERRKNINNFKTKFNNNNYIIKISDKLPEKLRPNKEGISNAEYKIYEKFQVNNNVLEAYEKDGKMSAFLNIVYRILKEVMDKTWEGNGNTSMKISKYKNYEQCMKNIFNIFNKKEFDTKNNLLDEEQFSLNFLKNIIVESKIDKIDVINKMAMKTLDFVFISAKMNNLLLLNVYMFILRGWSKLNDEVNNQITKRIFEYDFDVDIFTLFKYELHLLLFKQKLINIYLYQEYMFNLLNQSSVVNNIIHHLLNRLLSSNNYPNHEYNKNSFRKIQSFISNQKFYNNYYLLFNKKTSILIDMARNYNLLYKTDNNPNNNSDNDNSDNKDKKELNNLYLLFFIKITNLGENLIFQNGRKFLEENKIENMFSESEILKCIEQICEICMNITSDCKFKKYSYFFYPEKLSIFIYYLINYKSVSFLKILDIIIQCFHRDYIVNKTYFNQKKYYKFFINLINLISNPPSNNDKDINQDKVINHLILICDTLRVLSPKNYPGFTTAWLDLISYHNFINNFLDTNLIEQNAYKYEKYLSLLIDILSYLNQIKALIIKHYYYKYILDEIYKFFYILVNTYPCFVAAYYYLLISCLSLSMKPEDEETNVFIQIKNIILSASIKDKNFCAHNFLNKKLLKDNNIPNIIIYLITDSSEDDEKKNNEDFQLKILVNKYFSEKSDENILEEILEILDNIKDDKKLNYVYNGIAIYMCQYKIKSQKNNDNSNTKVFYNFYLFLLCNLNEIHKKHLIDSILNLLRFDSLPTIEFSSLFQDLLLNIENEDIEKQLIFHFLERIFCVPIPWGIRYTYKLLMKNEKFKNMKKIYLKDNEEIENALNKIK